MSSDHSTSRRAPGDREPKRRLQPPAHSAKPLAPGAAMLRLQSTAGNQAVAQLVDEREPAAPAGVSQFACTARTEHRLVCELNRLADAQEGPRAPSRPSVFGLSPASSHGRRLSQGMARDRHAMLSPSPAEVITELKAQLAREFEEQALVIAHAALNRNEQVVGAEAGRYAENSSGDPATTANALRTAAVDLAAVQEQIISRLNEHGNEVAGRVGAPSHGVRADCLDDHMEGLYAQDDEIQLKLLPQLRLLKSIYGPTFPILLQRNVDYRAIAESDPKTLEQFVASSTTSVLTNIRETRERLVAEKIWALTPVVAATKLAMGIMDGTPAGHAIAERRAQVQADEAFRKIALAALAITLGVALTVATLGAGAPAAAGAASSLTTTAVLGTAGSALSVHGAIEEYAEYQFHRSARGASLDPAQALSAEDPSVAWLAIAIIAAVADLGAAVMAFRHLAAAVRLARQTRRLATLEQAARAQARTLLEEGKLVGMSEDEFVEGVLGAHGRGESWWEELGLEPDIGARSHTPETDVRQAPLSELTKRPEWEEIDTRLKQLVPGTEGKGTRTAAAELHLKGGAPQSFSEKAGKPSTSKPVPRSDITQPERHILRPDEVTKPHGSERGGLPQAPAREQYLETNRVRGKRTDKPHPHTRTNDAEAKLLERVSAQLKPGAKGELHLRPSHSPCASCIDAIFKFRSQHPGVQVILH
jgi:hypothetical protein